MNNVNEIVKVYNELEMESKFQLFAKEIQDNIMDQTKDFPEYIRTFMTDLFHTINRMKNKSFGKTIKREILKYGLDWNLLKYLSKISVVSVAKLLKLLVCFL